MSLSPGTRLGPYEIVSALGAGGMGEVYRARDTRLGRDVAVKVLPEHLSASVEVRARFEREARAVSALNHPHICTLYDVGHESGTDYFVMELVEGETLAQRLGKGALPAAEALRIGAQIADALDGAHSAGIVHRDLKPGNVMLTKGGAKLMDFGLARAIGIAPAASDLTHSPTASRPLTAEGTILGTFQYMAPEQLEGKDAGAPADLWALGCVLYEMTTGKRAFKGESQASLIGAIMNAEPAEMSQLAPLSPPALERVVKACLAKDPTDRLHSAHDVRLELQWIAEAGSQAGVSTLIASRRRGRERIAWTLAAIGLVAAAASLFVSQRNRHNDDLMQMSIEPTVAARLTDYPSDVPVSPDGRSIAFGAADSTGRFLWVRPLDADEARRVTPVPGDPEENLSPFWSPDGREIAYFGGGKLKKVAVAGGIPVTLCDAKSGRGGSWNNDGVIVFSPEPEGPLFRVSAAGGEATAVTSLDSTRHETSHRFPHFLPDRDHFLFAALPPGPNGCDLFVGSLKSKGVKKIATAASAAIYAEPGYLVYERGGNVVAHRFDRGRVEVAGDAVAIVAAPAATDMTAEPVASASRNGRLVILERRPVLARLVWVDRTGTPLDTIPLEPSHARPMRLSHDGRRVAVLDGTEMRVVDLERSIPMRFADTFTRQATMAWSPDDDRIAFVSAQSGREEIYVTDAGGVSEPEMRRTTETQFKTIYDWSPDGRYLVIGDLNASTSWDLWLLPMSGADKPERYIRGNQFEGNARISPDGRWLAYMSDESGAPEVYVQSFPKPGRKTRVSTDLGFDPSWSRGGQELLYASTDSLMSVAVEDGDDFRPGTPRPLFSVPAHTTGMVLTADGERALVSVASEEIPNVIRIIFNWTALLK